MHKKAFIAFIMAGDPDLVTTARLVERFDGLGVDIVELGIPFSDPLADGPTIQGAAERSLKNKINTKQVFQLVARLRNKIELPIVILTYYNIIFRYGLRQFIKDAKSSGIDGVIVPDLPPEESAELRQYAKKYNFSIIHLLSPTSPEDRIKLVDRTTRGFIYYVSLTGTTGARKKLPEELIKDIKKIKTMTRKPLCVGFGVSIRQQVRQISGIADGVIVGSAIIKIIEKNLGKKVLLDRVVNFVKILKNGICSNNSWRRG